MNSCREGGGFREQAERPESVRVFRHLLCPLGPCTIQGRGVRLAREQRQLQQPIAPTTSWRAERALNDQCVQLRLRCIRQRGLAAGATARLQSIYRRRYNDARNRADFVGASPSDPPREFAHPHRNKGDRQQAPNLRLVATLARDRPQLPRRVIIRVIDKACIIDATSRESAPQKIKSAICCGSTSPRTISR